MMPSRLRVSATTPLVLAIALGATIACGRRRGPALPPTTTTSQLETLTPCTVPPVPTAPADSINAVFTTPLRVDAAPAPNTPAEQFVFANAYETLLRIECHDLATGLAKSWAQVDGTDRWRIVLRPDARFWSGTRVTAADVVAAWRATGRRPAAALARHLAEQAAVVDDTTLDVRMGGIALRALGSAELAVARPAPGSRWPEGSGRYRLDADPVPSAGVPGRSMLTLTPVGAGLPRIIVYMTTTSDARDLVDLGADLVVTDDRALSTYVGTRPLVAMAFLDHAAWSWIVVSRGAQGSFASTAVIPGPVPAGQQEAHALTRALASDVVRAHARPVGYGFWSLEHLRCDSMALPPPTHPPASLTSMRVAYRRDEPVAQAIAERLVALASAGDHRVGFLAPGVARAGDRVSAAVGLAPNEFAAALREGRELAFVVSIRRHPNLGCVESQPLVAMAPWIADQSATSVPRTVATLIETAARAFVMTGDARLAMTDDGTLVVLPLTGEPRSPR